MEKNEVRITRLLAAPIEKVWDAWTKAENLMQWEAPEGMSTPDAKVNLEVGGAYFVTMTGGHAGENKLTVGGIYTIIDKPKKLEFSWRWDGQEEETKVTVLFKSVSKNKTELTLIHRGFENKESYIKHNTGWKSTCNKLENFVR